MKTIGNLLASVLSQSPTKKMKIESLIHEKDEEESYRSEVDEDPVGEAKRQEEFNN